MRLDGRKAIGPAGLLTILWILAVMLVGPAGDFPLNDDWAYGQSVKTLLSTGLFKPEAWMAMTLVAQVFWGALFCLPFGFSFTALRFSTLVLALVGILSIYGIGKLLSRSKRTALFLALMLAFNPWYFSLSFTFMTDVPFLGVFLLANYFFLRALRSENRWMVLWGTLIGLVATLIRQFGLLAPLGFGIAFLLKKQDVKKAALAFLPVLLIFAGMLGYMEWLTQSSGLPEGYGKPGLLADRLRYVNLIDAFRDRAGVILFYSGLFLLPVTLIAVPVTTLRSFWNALFSGVTVLGLAWFAWDEIPSGNIFYNLGLGPKVLKLGLIDSPESPKHFAAGWTMLKILGFTGGWLLLWSLMSRKTVQYPPNFRQSFQAGVVVMLVLYLGYLFVDYYFWDRYLMVLLPLIAFLMFPEAGERWSGIRRGLSILFLSITAAFSVAATHDYFAWNEARWRALAALQDAGIPADQIDGGFEFNAWKETGVRRAPSKYGKSWWFVNEDNYVVNFDSLPCYRTVDRYAYQKWLPPGLGYIYTRRRDPSYQIDSIYFCDAERLTPDGTRFRSRKETRHFLNGIRQDSSYHRSGEYAIRLTPASPYGFTTHLDSVEACARIAVQVWRYAPQGQGTGGIVFSTPGDDGLYEFQAYAIRRESSGWELLQHEITIPPAFEGETLSVFIWNPGGSEEWFDDLELGYSY